MKRSLNLALALLVVLALAFAMFAVAETPAAPEPIEEIEMDDTDIEAGGDGETGMGEVSLALGDLVSEGPGAPATVVYRFIVDEAEYRVQQVREGEAVLRPEDPAAPEGMAFAAWVLADGTPLFVDADGDGEADPVIARADAQGEVKVWGSFAPTEETPADEQPAEEQPTDEQPSEEQPTDGVQEPSPATEGSDSGEGGAAAPEEVVPQAETAIDGEGEGETTSSDSPDGEPASPKGEALSAPEETPTDEQPSDEQLADEQPTDEQPIDKQPTDEQPADEQPAEEQPSDEQPTDEQPADGAPVANALVYTGEAQALVSAGEGWLFSVDGEAFTADIPVAVDAGDYTVFYKAAEDAEAQALTVTVAKADVVLVPPEAMTGEE